MSHIRGLSLALITLISGLAVLTALYLAVDLVKGNLLNGVNLALITLAILASFEAIFPLPAGCRAAVIGETGSGKSTLVHLLVRFWDPATGRIRVGDEDIRNLNEAELRRSITVISQQPHMFNTTLRDNLLLARPGADDDDLFAALASARLDEFVKTLPDGLDTWIGEAAKLLSGGQAQRVALARAILHDGPLWVLDEPTEGLDTINENILMQTLKRKTRGRTLLLITHRLVDLDWMDHIVMLDKGRIRATGTHSELLARNRRYAELHMRLKP